MSNRKNNFDNANKSIATVTGSSAGIGLQTSLLLARNGFYTYASVRDLEKSQLIEDIAKREKSSFTVITT